MSAKRVIALTTSNDGTNQTINGVFWFPITSGMRPQTNGSQWVANGTSAGASTQENAAIQAGTILELNFSKPFPVGQDIPTIQLTLQQLWVQQNAQINGIGPDLFYGAYYDGTQWANQ